ncbi:Spike glycoprotein [Frankliniella fusca]|uniref:Spike glycoprotein n=1 Tax=Frankliniella fusca TaxID=407009 RepID=A0AAE1LNG7_9NEOP|nr:Spike glycoprotein [Frankliniella fusca]
MTPGLGAKTFGPTQRCRGRGDDFGSKAVGFEWNCAQSELLRLLTPRRRKPHSGCTCSADSASWLMPHGSCLMAHHTATPALDPRDIRLSPHGVTTTD